jgi:hypothetical protein
MDEIEVVGRVDFAGTEPVDLAGGGFVVVDMLCREVRGARLTPSETEALGRDAEEAAEPAGDTTEARVALAEDGGFVLAEADRDGFAKGGAVGFEGATESLLLGAAEGTVDAREVAVAGLDVAEDALVDFLSTGAADEGFTEAVPAVVGVFVDGGLTEPAPKVPEFMIWKKICQ